ncbi:response regulator transcription factor [Danxiaibacter flavus]|uniref:Response regulator transcription factor n=1 Tax=Danxiaibacter flavus TaxID=3049108 RepID=A0ABV3ZK44_9BACT|nr:response regulator transcription factor [Chitinophagaceae bacterium DXS]
MNILIVDDHAVIRQTLGMIINTEFPNADCSSVETGRACLDVLQTQTFDLVILDLNLPDIDGVKIAGLIRNTYPEQMILVFSMNPSSLFAAELYRLGVMGYLNKQADISEIRKALNTILRKKIPYKNAHYKTADNSGPTRKITANPFTKLSQRELEVARLLAKGKSMEEIASHLCIGASTIRTYKARVFEKLEVASLYDFLTKVKLYELEVG